jgi:hypothetical protein
LACTKQDKDYWHVQAAQIEEKFAAEYKAAIYQKEERRKEFELKAARIYNRAFEEDMGKRGFGAGKDFDAGIYDYDVKEDHGEVIKTWPKRAYTQGYHTVAECEAVIKSLREMVDKQQEYIYQLLSEMQGLKYPQGSGKLDYGDGGVLK